MDFETLASKIHINKPNEDAQKSILALDPGHTTGWAHFYGGSLIESGEIDTTDMWQCVQNFTNLFDKTKPEILALEDYRVYRHKKDQHVNSAMLTTRVIGSIETIAIQRGVGRIVKRMAHLAKGFCTDSKLKDWGMYATGQRHARDAIRHGCYFILFGATANEEVGKSTVG